MHRSLYYKGKVTSTAADLAVECGFVPRKVVIQNVTNGVRVEWSDDMADGSFIKIEADGTRSYEHFKQIVIPAASTPGQTAALTLTTLTDGTGEIPQVNFAIVDGGTGSGTAVVETGSGTVADPYVYTITAQDDDNDNDTIIAVIAALSGEVIVATGSNATATADPQEWASTEIPNKAIRVLDANEAVTFDDDGQGFIIGAAMPHINDTTETLFVEAWR